MPRFWWTLLLGLQTVTASPVWAAETQTKMTHSDTPPIVALLQDATKDLQMPSETDAPFRVFFVPSYSLISTDAATKTAEHAEKISPEKWAETLELKSRVWKETRSIQEFFESVATAEDWMEPDEQKTAVRFGALLDCLEKNVRNPQVYLFGDTEMEVIIVGEVEGGFAGVITLIVET